MLINTESVYFIKIVFSFLSEGRKLKINKYNKILQNKIDINLTKYKLFSGRYIDYDKVNKKGEEYNLINNNLIHEGEYLNGKRNGEGKEYDIHKNLVFEGKYLNGKKWDGKGIISRRRRYELNEGKGFIKGYDKYNDLFFEGDYLNGERNGKGKEYDPFDYLLFEGEYLNGKRWNGKVYDNNYNKTYELKNGKGFIKEYLSGENILIFEGNYLNGERNGKGKEYYDGKLIFEGEYLNGKRNGKGKEYDSFGNILFEGEFYSNFRIKGKKYIKGILEYEGDYLLNKKWTGKGYDETGKVIYELINGNGIVKLYDDKDSLIYEGEYLNGEMNGKGKEYNHDNNFEFEGEYLKGKIRNGQKKEYFRGSNRKLRAVSKFINGEKKERIEYYFDGQIKFEGEYLNGKKWNGKGKIMNFEDEKEKEKNYEVEYINGEMKKIENSK